MSAEQKITDLDIWDGFKHLRDDFSDQIPQERISSFSENKGFKVRTMWFQALAGQIERATNLGLLSDFEVEATSKNFLDKCFSDEFRNRSNTTPQDIEEANSLINLILCENR